MSSSRERPVTASVAAFTSMILPSTPMVTSGSRLASIRLRLYALADLPASASAARRLARSESCPAVTAVTRKAVSATQFCGSAIVKV